MKNVLKNNKGYTLVEMLAVIMVIVTVGSIITGIIVASLRDSNRSTNVNEVRQAGNFALTQIAKTINYAKTFEGVAKENDYLNDGTINYTRTCSTVDTYQYIKITTFDNIETTYFCDNSNRTLSKSTNSGWDPNSLNFDPIINMASFYVNSCSFTCSQPNISIAPTIKIMFTVSKISASIFAENKVNIPFETTVGIRNFENQP